MLSSDGLHGVVPEQRLEEILRDEHKTLHAKCDELISTAHSAGSPDNVTVLLIQPAA